MVESNYYRNFLSDMEQEVYDRILGCWVSHSSVVVLPSSYTGETDSAAVVRAVSLDHPEVFWVDYYHYSEIHRFLSTNLTFTYFMNEGERSKAEKEVNDWKNHILQYITSSISPKGKLWMLYDYLARQVSYVERGSKYSHTLLGCVPSFGHAAVCEGIAKGYKYLTNAVDLPCTIIQGYAYAGRQNPIPHAWNMIQTTKGQLHIDVLQPGIFLKESQRMAGYRWERRKGDNEGSGDSKDCHWHCT